MKKTSVQTATTTTAATPAATVKATTGTSGAVENCGQTTHNGSVASGTTSQPTGPANLDEINTVWCDLIRLGKAMIAAAITAGSELAAAERELVAGFDTLIATRTPWNLPEARGMIRFAREAGLQRDRLTPAADVALGRMLGAMALLGRVYMEQFGEPSHEGIGATSPR
jgi:hypothetical protein